VTADEAYLREAILNPSQHITQGYAPIMPTYQGQVSEEGVIALVEYIKNLNSDYRIEQTLNTTDLLPESEGAPRRPTPASAGPAVQKPAPQGKVNQ
jgi:cytochrome c oxidase subunit 2